MEGTHSPALGMPRGVMSWKSAAPTGEHLKPGALPLIPAQHPEHSRLSGLLSSFSSAGHSISNQFPPLPGEETIPNSTLPIPNSTLRPMYTLTPHPQPLRQLMPHQLLSAHPNSTCPSRLTSRHVSSTASPQSQSLQLKKL